MTRREGGTARHLWLGAALTLLTVTACGGTGTGSGQATPTVRSSSPAAAPGHTPASGGAAAASKGACALISAADAAAALGMAVGKARPAPGVGLANGAVGQTCEWTDSAGGVAGVVTLTYPSAAIAGRVFRSSQGSAASARQVRLPDLAPSEFADTGSYGGTRIAEGVLLDGDRELDVTINEPTSGPGSRFSLPAFVTLVQQAAGAWR